MFEAGAEEDGGVGSGEYPAGRGAPGKLLSIGGGCPGGRVGKDTSGASAPVPTPLPTASPVIKVNCVIDVEL